MAPAIGAQHQGRNLRLAFSRRSLVGGKNTNVIVETMGLDKVT